MAKEGDVCVADWEKHGRDDVAAEAASAVRNSRRFKLFLRTGWLSQLSKTCGLGKGNLTIGYLYFFRRWRFPQVTLLAVSSLAIQDVKPYLRI
jgi:hypothetical protein